MTMKVVLTKTFRFEAAHHLPLAPDDHKCRTLHGHSFHVEIKVEGEVDEKTGWFMDYGEIASAFEPLRRQLDHCVINDIPGLEPGTAEYLSAWIYRALKKRLPGLKSVTVRETDTSSCTYYGE